ncbi:MAG: hypothetical protein ACUVUG_07015 [Candidatus Aminicenantia bacterium]
MTILIEFEGEIVIFENRQRRGSLRCDDYTYYSNYEIRTNAENEMQSFLYLVEKTYKGYPVSAYLLDNIRNKFFE